MTGDSWGIMIPHMAACDPASTIKSSAFLRKIDPGKNCHRFYALLIERDLFGNTCLVRHYGRIGTQGHEMVESFPSEGEAQRALESLLRRKLSRGYITL